MKDKTKKTLLGVVVFLVIQAGIIWTALYLEDRKERLEEEASAPTRRALAQQDSIATVIRDALAEGKQQEALFLSHLYLETPHPLVSGTNKEMRGLHKVIVEAVKAKADFWYSKSNYDSAAQYYSMTFQYGHGQLDKAIGVDTLIDCIEHSSLDAEARLNWLGLLLEQNPRNYSLMLHKALILKKEGRKDQAREVLKKATEQISKEYESKYGKAYALVMNPKKDQWPSYHQEIFLEYAKSLEEAGYKKLAKTNRSWANFLAKG